MKWYKRLDVVGSLILFFIFLSLSFVTRENEWFPEFFMIMAEAALSVVIVLEIVEVSIRRERERQWKKVKKLIYSDILSDLGPILSYAGRFVHRQNIDNGQNIALAIGMMCWIKFGTEDGNLDKAAMIKSLSNSIRNYYLSQKFKSKKKDELIELFFVLQDCFKEISEAIDEYRVGLTPRLHELSDDEEVYAALLRFENRCKRLHLMKDLLNDPRGNIRIPYADIVAIWWNPASPSDVHICVVPALSFLADYLDDIADLYELLQEKRMHTQEERGLIEESVQRLKYWWLPPSFWE